MPADVEAVVVDDSRFMRTMIGDILEEAGVEVVAEAADGAAGVERVVEHAPDVVTMDVEMPGTDGLTAVERIMDERPTPVLMLSAHTGEGTDTAFEALERGAVDVFAKPGGEVSAGMSRQRDQLVEKVVSVARSDVTAASADRPAATAGAAGTAGGGTATTTAPDAASYHDDATLVVGASTGGPQVVERVVSGLPPDADLRVLVVQHMPEGFTGRFATRLDERSRYDVYEADGGTVGPGEVAVAPGGRHLRAVGWRRGRLRTELTDDPPVHGCRPSVDVTMRSVAGAAAGPLVGVLLTGMGEDGAAGMRAVDAAGGHTIAQDEETSTIFGMPREAIATGAVDRVLPAADVAAGIRDHIEL
ncbi:MAG: chemotaxis-specific protein-glutamate methyltransferase CheB [Haloferacaceae archaeon]